MAQVIGQAIDRIDGRAKVTGAAAYAADNRAERMAFGSIVTATIACGHVTSIDANAARRMPGVLLVMTHGNAPKQAPFQAKADDRHARPKPQLASDKVEYFGQPVALVVAETAETARAAASAIVVTYEKAEGAFVLESASGAAYNPGKGPTGAPSDSKLGDFDKAFADASVKIDAIYKTPYQAHAMMEPHASLASWQDGKLTVTSSLQLVESAHKSIADTLKLEPDKVEVISEYVGGGFGGKLPVFGDAILAALAARELNRPVRVALTRQQMFHVTTHRPASIQRVRLGAERDGTLSAIAHQSLAQSARADEFAEPIVFSTRSLYAAPNRMTSQRIAALDLPVADSMRAPGEAIGLLAVEQAMDELAVRLDMDPLELRLRNEPKEDPEKKVPFSTRALVPCLQEGARRFGWDKRQARPGQVRDGNWLLGMGVAAAIRGNFLREAEARVTMESERHAVVEMDMTDIGTGSYTVFAQIAAELLDLPVENIKVKLGHSSYPDTPGSGGSFGASSCGAALHDACTKLKAKLAKGEGAQGLSVTGSVKPGDDYKRYSQYAYGAHFAEVGIEQTTGEVRLRRMLGVFAAGRILNPKTAHSQLIGGMIWGLGSALHEDAVLDPRLGAFVTQDLVHYHVPVHADVPQVEAVLLDEFDAHANVLGSKGVGELGICGAGAAVANAVYNACGARVRDYPITLDKVLPALTRRQG
ncbi:xanthine dehydrogenase family protein molybdopterin-binding subunit [Reyranella soli]|uniref:Xanthine dehydrogenase n=1 Tax=Reyranella soli TaxID=1230389 RepID=A0A512NQ72_9HYPH|nr:xanthine dehydrogenase family protein molybdopterin-binding subunit [Reyranella soli]GEP61098.1 xanthine dehydrogenase [Reyranella soli]